MQFSPAAPVPTRPEAGFHLWFFASWLLMAAVSTAVAADEKTTTWSLTQVDLLGGHATTVLGQPEVTKEGNLTSIHFNGSTDGLLVPVNPLQGLSAFTIEVLFKPDANGPAEQRFLHVQDGPGNRTLMEIRMTDHGWALDTYLFQVKPESKLTLLDRTKLHPADHWAWVALTYADGHMAHYIDGELELAGPVNFAPTLAGQISLGVRQNKVYWFKGSIAEVRVHAVALKADELQTTKTE